MNAILRSKPETKSFSKVNTLRASEAVPRKAEERNLLMGPGLNVLGFFRTEK